MRKKLFRRGAFVKRESSDLPAAEDIRDPSDFGKTT